MSKNLAAHSDNKIRATIARNLVDSRQFFSRQVVSLQRTLGIRSHTMRVGLAARKVSRKAQKAGERMASKGHFGPELR